MSAIVKGIIGVAEIVAGVLLLDTPWGVPLIAMGVSTLLATAASLINPAKKPSAGLQTQIAYDPAFPRQLIVGRTITAGSLVAQFTHDNLPGGGGGAGQNRVLELVIALADHECDDIETIIVNGQVVNVGTYDATLGNPITQSISPLTHTTSLDYTGKMWVMFHLGADGQTADSHLQSVLGSQWPSTSVGTNICYARVTCVYDAALFGGIPQLQFVLRGAKLYDPRLDSTVGGSGSQVWGTPSTYAWTDNLGVSAYNICRGIYVGGKLFFGAGATAEEVPFAASVAAMNACDENVTLKAGGTEKRYAGGGQTAVSQDAQSFLGNIAVAMGGHIGTGGGSICILPGVAQTPVLSFTDDDIMARASYDNAPKFGFDSLKNAVFGTFVDPSQNWTRNSLPARTSSGDITEDGGLELADTYSFDLIYSNTRAQRVMEIIRRRNRCQITQTITLRPSAMVIERGDWVQWTSAQWSYSAKSFFVAGVQLQPNLDTVLSLIEIVSTVFDWVPSTDELAPAGGLLPSADPPAASVPGGVLAAPLTLLGDTGRTQSSFQVTFSAPNDGTIIGFQVEYRLHGTTNSQFAFTTNVGLGLLTLPNLVPNSTYDYRYQFVGVLGRVTPWSSWATFVTPNTQFGADDITNSTITALKFAAGITPVEIFSTLPVTGNFEGRQAVLTTTGVLYRYHSGAWTDVVDGAQIAAGTIAATSFAAGLTPVEVLATLPVSGNVEGRTVFLTTDGQLYRYHSGAFSTAVPAVNVGAGLTGAQIAATTISGSNLVAHTITAGQIAAGTITATEIAANTITASKIAAGTITATELAANSVTTGKISAGAVNAAQIAAQAITASKMFIGSSDNLILDGACIDLSAWSVWPYSYATTPFLTTGIGGAWVNNNLISWNSNASGLTAIQMAKPIACQPGDQFYAYSRVGDGGAGSYIYMHYQWFDATGAYVNNASIDGALCTGGPYSLGGAFTVPSGAAFVSLYWYSTNTTSSFNMTTPVLRKKMTGSLIVDGAIAANHMDVNSVTAGTIAAGAINVGTEIVNNLVVTGHIFGNAVTDSSVAVGASALIPFGSWGTLSSVTKTLSGTGDVLVAFTDYITWSSSGPRGFYRIVDNSGNLIMNVGYGGGSCPDFIGSSGNGLDTYSNVGSTTYYLQARWDAGNQPTSMIPALTIAELKK